MRCKRWASLALCLLVAGTSYAGSPPGQVKAVDIRLPEMHGPGRILRDVDGMAHVEAFDEHDALFLQGWLQAQDRLFQIDVLRRTAKGTLAELLGAAALPSDAELRVIGLGRAAQRSLDAYSPAVKAGMQAYADGVNAWVARNPLPPQYAALEITKFEQWTALDGAAIAKALAFQLSFDLDDGATTAFESIAPYSARPPPPSCSSKTCTGRSRSRWPAACRIPAAAAARRRQSRPQRRGQEHAHGARI